MSAIKGVNCIDKPTRVYGTLATLLDNIFSNNFENSIVSGNIVTDLTDHFSQVCMIMTYQLARLSYLRNVKARDYGNFFLNLQMYERFVPRS